MKLEKKDVVWTNLGRLKLFGVFVFIIYFFVFLTNYLLNSRTDEIELIKSDYNICKGVITDISLYKGHHIKVEFRIDNVIVTGSDGFESTNGKEVGDSLSIKYHVKDPNIFITELNKNYSD